MASGGSFTPLPVRCPDGWWWSPARHVVGLAELSRDETAILGPLLSAVSRALTAVTACQKVYLALFAEAEGFQHPCTSVSSLAGRAVEWVLKSSVAQDLVQTLIHSLPPRIGEAVSNALEFLLTYSIARVFTRELVRNLPSPLDHPLFVAARSLEIVGIARCLAIDADILQCACFCEMVKKTARRSSTNL
jgi:hypothetical protein